MGTKLPTHFMGAGGVVQVVAYESGAFASSALTIPGDDTIPQNTEGYEWATLSITPKSAANLLVIQASVFCSVSSADPVIIALFQDSIANALGASCITIYGSGYRDTVSLLHKMTAGTTSATTFKIRVGGGSNTIYINSGNSGSRWFGGVAASSFSIMEVAA